MICSLPYSSPSRIKIAKTPFIYPASVELQGKGKVIVEIGPGRGDFLFHLAETNSEAMVIGIEIKRKRVDKLIERIERRALKNIIVVQDDARCALPRLFGDQMVDEIHINFPDPWPKNRHAKNRAVNSELLAECCRALKAGGILSIATDHAGYAKDICAAAHEVRGLKACQDEPADVFPSLFALKWKEAGREIHLQRYQKK